MGHVGNALSFLGGEKSRAGGPECTLLCPASGRRRRRKKKRIETFIFVAAPFPPSLFHTFLDRKSPSLPLLLKCGRL